MAEYDFNANAVVDDGGGDFDNSPLPLADYVMMAIHSEECETQAKDGEYLEFEFVVIEGQYKDRRVWKKFNLKNRNQKAVDIAKREYKRFHEALGMRGSKRTEELHNKPFIGRVGVGKGDYAKTNEIKGFKPYGAAAARPAAAPAQTTAPSATAAAPPAAASTPPEAEKKPWLRN